MSISSQGSESLLRTLGDLVEIGPRWTGGEGERKAARYIMERFREAGIPDVRYEAFTIRTWRPVEWGAEFLWEGEWWEVPSYPIWYSGSLGPDPLEGETVHLGYGFDRDLRRVDLQGKIAVVRSRILLNYYPTHSLLRTFHRILEGGASGYVVLLDSPPGLLPRYNHLHEDEPSHSLPGLLVSGDDARFLDRLLSRRRGRMRIRLYAEESRGETGDVVAFLPGREDRWIIVGSHYDSVSTGAVDNAAANSVLLHLAAHFAKGPQAKGIVWAAHPGHEVNVGAREFVQRHEDLLPRVDCYISLDGACAVGYHWWPHGVMGNGHDEQRGLNSSNNPILVRSAIRCALRHGLTPLAYVPADQMVFNGDLEGRFYERNVPFVILIGKPIFYHTAEDTPQRVKGEALERSFLAHRDLIQEILGIPSEEILSADRSLSVERISDLFLEGHVPGPVEAVWFWVPECPHVGETVIFCIQHFFAPDTCILDVSWDFGDGTTGRGPACPHVFQQAGRYMVRLRVMDGTGTVHSFDRILWIEP